METPPLFDCGEVYYPSEPEVLELFLDELVDPALIVRADLDYCVDTAKDSPEPDAFALPLGSLFFELGDYLTAIRFWEPHATDPDTDTDD
ncbi:MAG: hypothetical protein SPI77_08030 [Corynebacterium sp.]|nr:hypothetical protein [Corynebacterium sp.]